VSVTVPVDETCKYAASTVASHERHPACYLPGAYVIII
jgi:hypothetical protein